MSEDKFYRCRHCGKVVNRAFGAEAPAVHHARKGTYDDPRAPGDHNDCCDVCCYRNEHCKTTRQ